MAFACDREPNHFCTQLSTVGIVNNQDGASNKSIFVARIMTHAHLQKR
jgi:hypothetical protein